MHKNNKYEYQPIGFKQYDDEPIFEKIDTRTEEDLEETPGVEVNEYIPGAFIDGNGNVVTKESFDANINKIRAETKSINKLSTAKLILYISLAMSILTLSYGAYNRYFKTKNNVNTALIQKNKQK